MKKGLQTYKYAYDDILENERTTDKLIILDILSRHKGVRKKSCNWKYDENCFARKTCQKLG